MKLWLFPHPPFFFPLDSLLWPEWHPLFAFSPWFSALGDRLWAGSKCWGHAETARGGCCYPTACHSGRWWRGPMWIAPVSLIERTLQLCYVLDCTWLMPFFCRLQAGHSCFFKENFVFLGRRKSTRDNIVSMYPILYSIIRHDQSPSCLSLPLFLVTKIMFKKKCCLGSVLLKV